VCALGGTIVDVVFRSILYSLCVLGIGCVLWEEVLKYESVYNGIG